MAIWLKQSTSVTVSMGPFLLFSDGVTLVTNLVGTGSNQTENTSTGIRIAKNGGAFAARHATAGTSTYDAFGNYLVILDTTDTNTLGVLRMQFANGAAFCPVWMDFMVVPANVWDSMFGASLLQIDVTKWLAGTIPAVNVTGVPLIDVKYLLGTVFATPATAGIPDVNTKNINNVSASPVTTVKAVQGLTTADTIATYTGNTPQTGDNYPRLGAPAGASVSADIAAVKAETADIDANADTLVAGCTLTSGERNSVADALLVRVITESYAALHSAPTVAQAICEIRSLLSEFAISGTTITTKQLDGSSTATVATLDSSTTPTTRTRTT